MGSQDLLDLESSFHSSFFSSQSQMRPRISSFSPYSSIYRYLATSSFSMNSYSLWLNFCVFERISAEDSTQTQNLKERPEREVFISSERDSMAGSSWRKETSGTCCFSTTIGAMRVEGAFSSSCQMGMERVEGPTLSTSSGLLGGFSLTCLAECVLLFSRMMRVRFFSSLGWGRLVVSLSRSQAKRCSDLDFRLVMSEGCFEGEGGSLCNLMDSSVGNKFSFWLGWEGGGATGRSCCGQCSSCGSTGITSTRLEFQHPICNVLKVVIEKELIIHLKSIPLYP